MKNKYKNITKSFLPAFLLFSIFSTVIFNQNLVHASTYTASIATSGSVSINATSQGNGATVGIDNLVISSSCPSGYSVSIQGPTDTNLYLDGDNSNNSTGTFIAPSTGTPESPVSITGDNLGTWGYSTTSSTSSGSFIGLTSTLTTLTSKDSASVSGGDNIPVYYGVSVPGTLGSGAYQMSGDSVISYYLTTSENCFSYLVSFNANGGTGTTMSDQRIYEGIATTLSPNTYTAPEGKVFKEWNTVSDGTGTSYSDEESVTDITSVGTTLPLYAIWEDDIGISCTGANKICYGKAAPDTEVEGTMGEQSANASTTVTLLASNYSREGYGFAGWNTEPDYTGTFYGPNEDITTPSDMSTGLALYAVWIESAGSLQDSTKVAELCGTGDGSLIQSGPNVTKTLSSVSALTDERDNQTYAIAKLADGNCWMIENLRLEAEATVGDNQYDPSKTNQSLAQGYNSSFTGLANAEAPWANESTTANSLYSIDGSTANTISGYYRYNRFPRYNNLNTPISASNRPQSPTSNTFLNNSTTVGMYSYGNYYTWPAAIADTTNYTTFRQSIINTSICPSGWKLPYGERGAGVGGGATSGGFSYLDTSLGGTGAYQENAEASRRWRNYPNNFIYSGNVYNSAANNRGSYGEYWSSTAGGSDYSFGLSVSNNSTNPSTGQYRKYLGRTIRCVVSELVD